MQQIPGKAPMWWDSCLEVLRFSGWTPCRRLPHKSTQIQHGQDWPYECVSEGLLLQLETSNSLLLLFSLCFIGGGFF